MDIRKFHTSTNVSATQAADICIDTDRRTIRFDANFERAIKLSGLLGYFESGNIPPTALENFRKYGSQWRDDLKPRILQVRELIDRGLNQNNPPLTYSNVYITHTEANFAPNEDVGWIAQFYIKSSPFYFPCPTNLGLIGSCGIIIDKIRELENENYLTLVCPDPRGNLAMVMVIGHCDNLDEFKAFKESYDIVTPILDNLSYKYDKSLPIAHSLIIGVPSGTIIVGISYPTITNKMDDSKIERSKFRELDDSIALYREAMSSSSPSHQFLTFWKIVENCNMLRSMWRKSRPIQKFSARYIEKFPKEFTFGDSGGRSFTAVKNSLTDSHRNALAHGDFRNGRTITPARSEYNSDIVCKIPLLKYMSYISLKNNEIFLNELEKLESE